ncbi:hypothetical protein niasHT_008397 [Heterodera trifolii]|uniref:Uncharacterized protein n=1 Tax=Heterodera trifolii TaxID=157864 RepID=A0ABD2LNT0_9BILA
MKTHLLRDFALKKYMPFTEIEWKYVQPRFMSDNMKSLQRIVDLMAMWIARMGHDTPMLISISEMVLHAHLNDKKSDIGMASMGRGDLRLIYSSTIISAQNGGPLRIEGGPV